MEAPLIESLCTGYGVCAVPTTTTGGRTGLIHKLTDLTHHLVSGAVELDTLSNVDKKAYTLNWHNVTNTHTQTCSYKLHTYTYTSLQHAELQQLQNKMTNEIVT